METGSSYGLAAHSKRSFGRCFRTLREASPTISSGSGARKLDVRATSRPTTVLDASAVLAYLKREPGYEVARAAIEAGAAISTVNLAEVYARILSRGRALDRVAFHLRALGLTLEPFTDDDARASADLYPQTQPLGLSLGDRACLALGMRLALPVLTADRVWGTPTLPVEIQLLP